MKGNMALLTSNLNTIRKIVQGLVSKGGEPEIGLKKGFYLRQSHKNTVGGRREGCVLIFEDYWQVWEVDFLGKFTSWGKFTSRGSLRPGKVYFQEK